MPVPFPFVVAGSTGSEQTHTFRDAKGFTAVVRYFIQPNGADQDVTTAAIVAILAQIKLLTNAAYQGSSGVLSEYGVKQYGTAAAYGSVRMKAALAFQDASGAIHKMNIPAAKLAVFDTDEQTVLATAINALKALVTNTTVPVASGTPFVSSRDGVQWTNYMGGFFVARQTRKNKLFFLNSSLTPAEPGE